MKIVIAGGTGFIGQALIQKLLSDQHSVCLLTRRAHPPEKSSLLVYSGWDAKSPGPWYADIDACDAVINLAGEPIVGQRWTPDQKAKIINSRIESTNTLIEAISSAKKKPEVLINASAVGYYGHVENGEVTENSPKGTGFLADTCAQWESTAQRAEHFGVRVVCLRIGIVLDKTGGALPKILLPFRFFAGGPLGSGKQWFPWVHREDVCGAVDFLLAHSEVKGPVNMTAPNPVTMKEFCRTLGRVIKRPSWLPAPAFALKIMLGEMSEVLLTGQKAVPKKLLDHGYRFKYPSLEKALQEMAISI